MRVGEVLPILRSNSGSEIINDSTILLLNVSGPQKINTPLVVVVVVVVILEVVFCCFFAAGPFMNESFIHVA